MKQNLNYYIKCTFHIIIPLVTILTQPQALPWPGEVSVCMCYTSFHTATTAADLGYQC